MKQIAKMLYITVIATLALVSLLTPSASQIDNTTLTLPARVIDVTGQVCPPDEVRVSERNKIAEDVRGLLHTTTATACQLSQTQSSPAVSCSALPTSCPSGYYWIRTSNGSAVQVYCDMDRVCGCNGTGGWTRIAYLNMTDPNQQCPQAWREVSSPKRTCRRTSSRCESEYFNTYSINYTSVCGRVVAYQYGSTDAFGSYLNGHVSPNTIDNAYIDGISITHGQSPKQHIWTFASALKKVFSSGTSDRDICACTDTSYNWPYITPSWVGNDYFCDSGNPGPGYIQHRAYSGDPLWDGQGCPSTSTCCQFNNPPWFCKQLPQAMADSIEVRICSNSAPSQEGEGILVELIELYIQ